MKKIQILHITNASASTPPPSLLLEKLCVSGQDAISPFLLSSLCTMPSLIYTPWILPLPWNLAQHSILGSNFQQTNSLGICCCQNVQIQSNAFPNDRKNKFSRKLHQWRSNCKALGVDTCQHLCPPPCQDVNPVLGAVRFFRSLVQSSVFLCVSVCHVKKNRILHLTMESGSHNATFYVLCAWFWIEAVCSISKISLWALLLVHLEGK